MPTSASYAQEFGDNVRFKFHQQSGARVDQVGAHEVEQEVLLPAGTFYKVLTRKDGHCVRRAKFGDRSQP